MPTIDIDGRGQTPEEAVQDMWARMLPLEDKGYHAVSSVEIVDMKSKTVVETFELTDPDWSDLKPAAARGTTPRSAKKEHAPPKPHEFKFKARIKLEY